MQVLSFLLIFSRLASATCPSSLLLPADWTASIPQATLPSLLSRSLHPPQHPATVLQIHNTLAYYPLALDGKNFSALSLVFADDIVANYSTGLNVLSGLGTLQSTLQASLEGFATQHGLLNQIIDVREDECTAVAVTYFAAFQYGVGVSPGLGNVTGKTVHAYGQYQDYLVRNESAGGWRVKGRNLVYMGLPFEGTLFGLTSNG